VTTKCSTILEQPAPSPIAIRLSSSGLFFFITTHQTTLISTTYYNTLQCSGLFYFRQHLHLAGFNTLIYTTWTINESFAFNIKKFKKMDEPVVLLIDIETACNYIFKNYWGRVSVSCGTTSVCFQIDISKHNWR
jgi:hypothetical protein